MEDLFSLRAGEALNHRAGNNNAGRYYRQTLIMTAARSIRLEHFRRRLITLRGGAPKACSSSSGIAGALWRPAACLFDTMLSA